MFVAWCMVNNKRNFQLADLKTAFKCRQEDKQDTNHNNGQTIGGPWVVGLCYVLEIGSIDPRYFTVKVQKNITSNN